MPQILVHDLRKTYRIHERDPGVMGALRALVRPCHRTVQALEGVSFALERGELLGFIGPNGAGKSTTIKILAGILRPDGGRVEVDGRDPFTDRQRHVARIGVVFGQRSQLWWDLPVGDGFDLLRDLYRVDPLRFARTRDELVALLNLERLLDQPVRQLSLGQRMRAEIAAALLHEPDILFLDEPTIALARRVIVIGHGRVLADCAVDALRAQVVAAQREDAGEGEAEDLAIEAVIARFYAMHGASEV
jgi:ABC-2 type transport system ATP-binding protein